jgi:hypothetical protein
MAHGRWILSVLRVLLVDDVALMNDEVPLRDFSISTGLTIQGEPLNPHGMARNPQVIGAMSATANRRMESK